MLDRLRHLLRTDSNVETIESEKVEDPKVVDPEAATISSVAREASEPTLKISPSEKPTKEEDADIYLNRVREKIGKLAEEFAAGMINREQFQELFDHYQREQRTIEAWLDSAPESDAWRDARTEGRSIAIRRRHVARPQGYAIYQNESGMPITTIGEFELDAALIIPMLSSYRSATREIFGAGMRSTQIENGQWLCFVQGEITTLMALFSREPASKQLEKIEEIHRIFERANRHLLSQGIVEIEELALPHESLITKSG